MSSFPPWEESGDQIRKWMENASKPGCKVARITLTLDTLSPDRSDWDIASSAEHLEPEHYKWLERVGIPTGVDKTSEESVYRGTMVMKSEGDPFNRKFVRLFAHVGVRLSHSTSVWRYGTSPLLGCRISQL